MRSDRRLLLFVGALWLLASTAQAQEPVEYGAFDASHRAIVGIGGSYEFYSATGSVDEPAFDKEFSAGIYGGWNVVPRFSLVGSVAYAFDNSFIRSTVGGAYDLIANPLAPLDIQARLQYETFYANGDEPVPGPGKEFTVGLAAGYPLNRWLVAVGASNLGVDTKQLRSYLGLRALVVQPKL